MVPLPLRPVDGTGRARREVLGRAEEEEERGTRRRRPRRRDPEVGRGPGERGSSDLSFL